jgi:hypothetical protein
MSTVAERARALVEMSALERSMRTLLSMIEARSTDLDGVERATEKLISRRMDLVAVVDQFRGAGPAEIAMLRRKLERLAELDAVLRAVCSGEMATTASAIRRVRSLRTQLDALATVDSPGDTLDCVR